MSLSREAWFSISRHFLATLAFVSVALAPSTTHAQPQQIDSTKSTVTVHVFKSGLFSGLAHDHVIQAPVTSGNIDSSQKSVTLTFNVADMKVIDPGVSDSERKEIDSTMQGPKVLDVTQFPAITFASSSVRNSTDRNEVAGTLKIHGVSRPITVPIAFGDGKYSGSLTLRQTDYGITPIKIAGGTVRVKDEIRIEFSIVPATAASAGGTNH